MDFKLSELPVQIGYKLLASTVTPRPIAWVTTKGADGVVNAAPYSFFNAVGSDPPTVVLGLLKDPEKGFKDTARNILDTGEFVINLVTEANSEKMNITCIDAPAEVSEVDLAKLSLQPSKTVSPPQIADSPVSFECVNHASMVLGPNQTLVVGKVLSIRIDDQFVLDAEKGYVDTPAFGTVGRLHGAGWYTRTGDTFQLERPRYVDWKMDD